MKEITVDTTTEAVGKATARMTFVNTTGGFSLKFGQDMVVPKNPANFPYELVFRFRLVDLSDSSFKVGNVTHTDARKGRLLQATTCEGSTCNVDDKTFEVLVVGHNQR